MIDIRKDLKPVPVEVVENVKRYLEENLSSYELLEVVRHSNHPDDDYLYMVSAKNKITGKFAVFTSWNETTQSLNFGHYNIDFREDCDKIFLEFFHELKN